MKKTIWQPLVLGVALGVLAGIAMVAGLSFLTPGTDINNAIGFWMTLLLLAAALGGPLAGSIASTILIVISTFFGPPDMRAILRDPSVFWTNAPVIGILMMLVGFAYRVIFERVKLPARLLYWAGIIIAVYIINSPVNLILQSYLNNEINILPAILNSYRDYIPQAIFDVFFTSLVFIALPARFRKPLWYVSKQSR